MKKPKFLVYWNPYEEEIEYSRTEILRDLFYGDPDIISVDLKNNKDPRSRWLLWEADLIVLFLHQSRTCLESYFQKDFIRQDKVLYVMVDYVFDGEEDWPSLLKHYEVSDDQMFFLPWNHRLCYMRLQGTLGHFECGSGIQDPYEAIIGYLPAYKQLRDKIYQSLFCVEGIRR